MSVEQPTVVDAIGTHKESGFIHLTITDHLEWNRDHLLKLQNKINSYLDFIEGGQLFETTPHAKDNTIVINLVAKYRPNEEGAAFLDKVASVIEQAGFRFQYGPLPIGYANDNG